MSKETNSTAELLKKSAVSRYLQLASLFRQRIDSGEWAVGERIPTVMELAEQCGVASMTIRQALDQLEKDGLIERFRAKGTFVRARKPKDLWCEVNTDWSGMLMARTDAQIEILEDRRNVDLPSHEGPLYATAPSYRHLRRRHARDGAAFLLADVYIDERLCQYIPEEAYSHLTAMRLVADIPSLEIRDARQIVTVGIADLSVATELDIAIGDPVARVDRIVVSQQGEIVLLARGIYRGDMMRIEVKLR